VNCSPEHALQTAKVYLLSGHEDGQLPFADMGMRIQGEDQAIKLSQEWTAEHYAQANPVEAMTQRAGLTRRTFTRRFRAATGQLPMDYVHAVRVENAKRIIEQDAGGIDDVAYQVGYEDPTFFRRLFKREVGLAPAAYRRKFSSILRDPALAVADH
jgi:transcriptional regulator GlxA family with amidase domain